MGRPSVFQPKDGARVQGVLTKTGADRFEVARRKLSTLAPHVRIVSDADVIEYLARGEEITKAYIAAHGPRT